MLDWLNQSVPLWFNLFTTPLEVLGFFTGAICVYLNTRQNVLGWGFGIVNALLYGLVFWQVKLYADMGLQGYYFLTSLYGWWMWLYGGQGEGPLAVSRTPKQLYGVFGVLFLGCTLLWGYLLNRFTDASLSYADSALTIASLIAQWMMARKYLENWLLWIVADVCYVGLYLYKGLPLTALLYGVFTLLAIQGYFRWRKSLGVSLG